jgi:hypothetical protein
MTCDISDWRLLDAPSVPGGNKDEWDFCSDSSHRGDNCRAVFFVATGIDSDPRSTSVGTPFGERNQDISSQLTMRDRGTA